jgi:type IV pilus assembly protein PilA
MNKKGFTLIELLATIVVLAIVAMIAVSTISGVIEKSRIKAFEDTGYGIISAAEVYYAQHIGDASKNLTFACSDTECKTSTGEKLSFKGNINGSGTLLLFSTGKTAICLNNGKYTTIKNYNETSLTTSKGEGCLYDDENLVFINMTDSYDASDISYEIAAYPDIETVKDALDKLNELLK